jgi:ribosome-associated translation inhibitor RaiA
MKILFHGDDAFTRDARDYVARRCESAFDRFESTIQEIRVTVRDENGPRGGDDIRCTIQVSLHRLADVIVHERASSLESAFAAAVDRASYQVGRRLSRHSDSVRKAVATC